MVRGYLYPQPSLHNDFNAPTCPKYSANIPGRRSFYRLECTSCLLYPIRARNAIPKVLGNLRIISGPSDNLQILRGISEASDPRGDLRASRTFGFIRRPSAVLLYLRLHQKTFGHTPVPSASSEDLRPYSRTFGFRPVAWGNLQYARWRSPTVAPRGRGPTSTGRTLEASIICNRKKTSLPSEVGTSQRLFLHSVVFSLGDDWCPPQFYRCCYCSLSPPYIRWGG